MASLQKFFVSFTIASTIVLSSFAQLTPDFYNGVCPQALLTIKAAVNAAILNDPRMGASLIRLHFHDCFVNGCDGSVLLDDTPTFTGEKTAFPNNNSLRGFDVIDLIKSAVNTTCFGNHVSCADILAVAARNSVVALGGAFYQVLLGRRDSTTASWSDANTNLPAPSLNLSSILSNFQSHGFTLQDLVVLSGGHTVGFARCVSFRTRIYNETNIDNMFFAKLQKQCPLIGGDGNLAPLDESPASFNTDYYKALLKDKGLLHSDQQLFQGDGSVSDGLVKFYSDNQSAFLKDFGDAMIKMGNMSPLTGSNGQIRQNCRAVN